MRFLFANNASTVLDGAILAADTSIDVINAAVFPSPAAGFTVRATIVRASDNAVEIIDISAISLNTLTINRAREGTTALDFADGDVIEMRVTAGMLDAFAQFAATQTYSAEQTFTETKETVYPLTGTDIDPANGSMQYKTLSANTTFTESLESGQGVRLRIAGGTTYTVTWPTTQWVGGAAPTLTANDEIVLYKEQSTLYGLYVGSVA